MKRGKRSTHKRRKCLVQIHEVIQPVTRVSPKKLVSSIALQGNYYFFARFFRERILRNRRCIRYRLVKITYGLRQKPDELLLRKYQLMMFRAVVFCGHSSQNCIRIKFLWLFMHPKLKAERKCFHGATRLRCRIENNT